jgi:hypothetical protein
MDWGTVQQIPLLLHVLEAPFGFHKLLHMKAYSFNIIRGPYPTYFDGIS